MDCDGELAEGLERQMRDGDIRREGVIWPHVAEISLLGGLGCGSKLIDLVLGELSKPDSLYVVFEREFQSNFDTLKSHSRRSFIS